MALVPRTSATRGEAQPQGCPCSLSEAELEPRFSRSDISHLSPVCLVGIRQPGVRICTGSVSSCITVYSWVANDSLERAVSL